MNKEVSPRHRMPPPQETPIMVINDVSKLFHDTMRENADPNVQGSYRSLLFHLAHEDGRTQLELSRLTHLKPPTVSITIRKMEADGYVTRVSDEDDMRQVRVYLTEKGRNYDKTVKEHLNTVEQKAMKDITAEEAETVIRILKCIRANLLEGRAGEEHCEHEHR